MASRTTDTAQQPRSHELGTTDIEFRGELIYFVVVDRFFDGDSSNNEGLDPNLHDASKQNWGKYWGGDLEGVIQKLDYLKELGVTAIWLTPLFEQIEAMVWDAAPSHGYWPHDYKRLNARWVKNAEDARVFANEGTTFDRMVSEIHARGMKVVFDIVCNHSSPDANGVKGQIFDDGKLVADFNDDKNNWYHHYGGVQDWSSEWQVQNCELAGLATFNENNDDYRRFVKDSMAAWLSKGVDALRIDTVKHMPLWFWQEFTSDMVAHKPDVFMFGEWIYSHPMVEASVEYANKSGMSILDFGLTTAIRDGIGSRNERGFQLVEEVLAQDHKYRSATELVTFLDNHDMPRFQSLGADDETLRLAVSLLLSTRGIPCLYYGTEQHLHNDTNGGSDPYNRPMMERFDTDGALFRDIRKLSDVRRENVALQFGGQFTKYITPDVYCYSRRYRGARCFVALNRGEATRLERVHTDLPDGEHRCVLTGRAVQVKDGHLDGLELGSRDVLILSVSVPPSEGNAIVRFQVNGCHTKPGEVVAVTGNVPELGEWRVERAYRLEYINDNMWQMGAPFDESAGKTISYKYVVLDEASGSLIPRRENRPARRRIAPVTGVAKWRDVWAT